MMRLKLIDSRGIDVPIEGVAIIASDGSAYVLEEYIRNLIEKGYLRAAAGVSGDRQGYFDCTNPVYELTGDGRKVLELYRMQNKKAEATGSDDPDAEVRRNLRGEEEKY